MKTVLLSTLFLAAMAHKETPESYHKRKHAELMQELDEHEYDETSPIFYIQGVRGFYLGLENGIHDGKTEGLVCLGKET